MVFRNAPQLFGIDQRLFKQCAAASGEQEQHRVLRPQIRCQIQNRLRAPKAVCIRYRMSGFKAGQAVEPARNMTVLGQNDAAVRRDVQAADRGAGHLPAGLACRDQQDPPGKGQTGQRTGDSRVRPDSGDSCADNGFRVLPQRGIHAAGLCP